jgi:oligopeptide transport system substrate-binding protein
LIARGGCAISDIATRVTGARSGAVACALAAIVALGALPGCGRTERAASTPGATSSTIPTSSPTAAGTAAILLRGNGPEPDSLDPQKARTAEAHTVLRDLCEGLTTLAHDASPQPGGASGWSVSADGREWTFHLRPQLRWSNGEPLGAEDFVAGLQRLVDPATASEYAQLVDVIENASEVIAGRLPPGALGVRAPDVATVRIRLRSPAPYLPGLLAHPSTCPVHRPSLARYGADFTRPGLLVSNGAFVLKAWLPNSYLLLERNRQYWNDAATRLQGVRYVETVDENAELRLYRSGALHVTNVVPRGQFDWIRANLGAELHVSPQLSTYYYGFNLDRPRFGDAPGLRQALAMAIDRERLASAVLRVGELPAYGWVPPGIPGYTPQEFAWHGLTPEARLREARRLYAAAGYSPTHPLRLELRYNAGEVHNKVAIAVASMWKESLGVETRLATVEFKSLMDAIDRRDVDVFRLAWVGDYDDAYSFLQYLKGNFGINLPHYRSAAYDALLERAAAEPEAGPRQALLEEAERRMLADTPLIPLYFYVNKHLVKPRVLGWYDNVMNVVYSKDLGLGPP